MLDLGISNSEDGWRGVLHVGEAVVWADSKPHETSLAAREAANRHVIQTFRALFFMEALPDDTNVYRVYQSLNIQELEEEALTRETYHGKSFTENLVEIIGERLFHAP